MESSTQNRVYADDPVVGYDLMGYPYNKKYPPNISQYGTKHDGYPTCNQEIFFLDFAVESYQVLFQFNDKCYLIQLDDSCALELHPSTHDIIRKYTHANALLEQMLIDGKTLLSRIDEVKVIDIF